MSATAFPWFENQYFDKDASGNVIVAAGYKLYQYVLSTTTNKNTYTDVAGLIANSHPITLDSNGRCTLYGTPGDSYTFVLKTAAGATIWTRDAVAPAIPTTGDFLELAGGTMTGDLILSGDATSSLEAVTKQQLEASITDAIDAVTTLTDAATAAAAAATAAAAAVLPETYVLASPTGTALSRSVTLAAGTWTVVLQTAADYAPGAEANHDFTVTQSATVSSTTVSTSIHFYRAGGSGYGRITHGTSMATGSLVVAASASVTLSIAAASFAGASGAGSMLTVYKVA